MNRKKILYTSLIFEVFLFFALVFFIKAETALSSVVILLIVVGVMVLMRKNRRLSDMMDASFSGENRSPMVIAIVLIVLLPFFFLKSGYYMHILTFALIYIIAAVGLNFQIGSCGMVNFAQSTFFGVGAYTTALLSTNFGFPFWVNLPIAIVITGIFGLALGYPTLKTKSFYLSLVSIAFCYIAFLLVHNMQWTGGPNGIAGIMKPKVFGFSLARSVKILGTTLPGGLLYYFFVLVFVLIAILLARRFHYSWMGMAWNALREDEISSRCYGINITMNKLYAFIFGSIFAGVAGVLYAHFVCFVSPESMTFHVGLLFVSMVILGGMDNVLGVVIGAALLIIIPEKFRAFQDFRLLLYGVILILMLLFRPQGLIPFKVRSYIMKRRAHNEE